MGWGIIVFHFSIVNILNLLTAIFLISDRKSDQRVRTVVVGPLELGELSTNELLKEYIGKACQYFLRMHRDEHDEENSKHAGYLILYLTFLVNG